jgi:glucosamine--fructose-6-phosphate aminotransferase (isomerizing)
MPEGNPMSILFDEIHQQPAAIERALTANAAGAQALVDEIKKRDIRYVIFAARGTSDNAATYAKYLWQITAGLPCGLAAPSVHTLYDAKVAFRDALVVGVSQSGAGEDVNEVISQAKAAGALTAAITNTPTSALAGIADHVLLCQAELEKAVAATKTYTTTLAIFAQLGAMLGGDKALLDCVYRLPQAAADTLAMLPGRIEPVASTLYHAERMVTVARGLHLCTAIESSLKIAETTGTATQSYSSADLLHGPIAAVGRRTPVLVFQPGGATFESLNGVVDKLNDRGARVIRINATENADIPLHASEAELLAPVVDILPAQLLAYHLTVTRGLDPDQPNGLSKVTITR